jgi:hypothetical protein
LNRKWFVSILAVAAAALLPLAASAQIAPDRGTPPDRTEPTYKYSAYAGFGYTSLNQVNQSRYGLIGVDLEVTRDWGRYFGLTADGSFYSHSFSSGNPGTPSVDLVLFGPELHAPLYGKVSGLVHVLLGGEHTGGESETPNISFAGGVGAGLDYRMSPRLSIRAFGDDILSSFSVTGNSSSAQYSPNKRSNPRASVGVVYHF